MTRLDEYVGSFWYSAEEEAAIVAALGPLESGEPAISASLGMLADAVAKLDEDAPEADHLASAMVADRQTIEAIDNLLHMVGWMDDHVFEEEAHPMANHVSAIRQHLDAVRAFSVGQHDQRSARKDGLDAAAINRGSRFLWYRERLFAAVADAWTHAGGEVDHGKAYRAFFDAALRPPLSTRHVQRITRCAWSDNLFSPHVRYHMMRAGKVGSRGPKRKTENGRRIGADEM